METEWGIWRRLLLLDPELFADVHVLHHQLVGGVDDAPPYLVLSPIHLVIIWHQIQYRDHSHLSLTFTVSSRPPEWASLASMMAI